MRGEITRDEMYPVYGFATDGMIVFPDRVVEVPDEVVSRWNSAWQVWNDAQEEMAKVFSAAVLRA